MKKWMPLALCLAFLGCQNSYQPKPEGFLALEFPPHQYKMIHVNCPYSFVVNRIADIKPSYRDRPCMYDIVYPKMDGTIYITYEHVHGNLRKLLEDAQKLPLRHAIKADQIISQQFANRSHNTYGMFYTITGNAASQAQFYLTDSTRHFMTGSIYFRREPNYDSIYPAAKYLMKDMRTLMESVQWK